tara:strand:- start:205 stop:393 length:189 start_codon:yes stop_codon:yes gene_type:complete
LLNSKPKEKKIREILKTSEKWSKLNAVLLTFFNILATCPSQKSKSCAMKKNIENKKKLLFIK